MHLSHSKLLLIAAPAAAASMAILTFGAVGRSVWIIQVLAICLGCALAWVGAQLIGRSARFPAGPIIVFVLLGIAARAILLRVAGRAGELQTCGVKPGK
jgi:hypothetical protein